MSFGLTIKNNNNEFLISDAMRNLHHHTTVTNPSIEVITHNYGGITRFTYTFTLNSNYIPVPFFTTPFTDRYYAIEKVSNSGNTWTVQLISQGAYPTETDNGTNPSPGSIVQTLSSLQYAGVPTQITSSAAPVSGAYYAELFHVGTTPIRQGTSFNGSIGVRIIWNGTVIPLVNSNSDGRVFVTATNGVLPINYAVGTDDGIVSEDGKSYFPFELNGVDQPANIYDNPAGYLEDFNPNNFIFTSMAFYKIKQRSYVEVGGSSGNEPTGSYGSVQIPKLIIFADARAVTGSETFGMTVLKPDGTAAFDNRKNPLIIKQLTSVSFPTNATNTFSGSGLSARNATGPVSTWSTQATPNQHNSISVNTMPSNPMFYYPTVTQRHQQVSRSEIENECDGYILKGNCIGSERDYFWRSTYWNFYRGGISRPTSTAINAGYINVEYGAYHSRTTSGSFFGFSTGNSAGSSVGKWAWDSSRINAAGTGVNTVLIGDATNYI